MRARHNKKVKVRITPLGYATIIIALVLTLTIIFVSCGVGNSASNSSSGSSNEQPKDTTAPVIKLTKEIVIYEDTTVSYRDFIEFSDDSGQAPTLSIDSSGVDLENPGTYEVAFSVTDAAGNKTSLTATVTVNKKPKDYVEPEVIYTAADKKLATLVNDNMSTRDKIKAIYNWANGYIPYTSTSDKTDYMMEAYRVLNGRSTDCFGYFAVTKLMFERLGIANIDVKKVKNNENDSNHYWSLVSLDGGKTYYHFDATPRKGDGDYFFLLSDADLDKYSDAHNKCHNRDESLYPATPEVSYDKK